MSGNSGRSFDPRIIGAVIIAGIVAFVAFAALSAFAPMLSSGRDGGGHALSRSALSYSALVQLLGDTGTSVAITRGNGDETSGRLLVLTPPLASVGAMPTMPGGQADNDAIGALLRTAGNRPALIVVPKWQAMPGTERRGFVGPARAMPGLAGFEQTNGARVSVTVSAHRNAAANGRISGVINGRALDLPQSAFPVTLPVTMFTPLLRGPDGVTLTQVSGSPRVYILADADLLNNVGVADPVRAAAAIRLVRALGGDRGVDFDVSLNGFGASRSLVRLAFTPPFLGLTLTLLLAGLLALWSGFVRFGPPWRDVRAIALGKAGLLASSARLIVQARRTPQLAERYGLSVRDAAARQLHAPQTLDGAPLAGAALDAWLDRFTRSGGPRFSELYHALLRAQDTGQTVAAAAALGQWRKDILREHD